MTDAGFEISRLNGEEVEQHLDDLCRVLADSVSDGAAISFMAPLAPSEAAQFWMTDVKAGVDLADRQLFGALRAGRLVGTVQLIVGMPPNQPHRAEIAKLIVHPTARGMGIATALMAAALDAAKQAGKSLVTLDTRSGGISDRFYRSIGFEVTGIVPDFALDPDGKALHPTTYMYKRL